MFQNGSDYSNNPIDLAGIEDYATENDCSLAHAAIVHSSPLIKRASLWGEIGDIQEPEVRDKPVLIGEGRTDLLCKLSYDIAKTIQFPESTIYLQAMGCVASALTKSFKIQYGYDHIPANLYVLTAQPPSTGKSSVNERLFSPIRKAYADINDRTSKERQKLNTEIVKLRREIEKEQNEQYAEECWDKLQQKEKRLEKIPEWAPSLTDSTIEAAESCAADQNGMFNIVSAEAESINVIFGAVYGDGETRKKNQGLLLSAWDGEYISIKRITRKGYSGEVRGSISVIAQDDSVDTVLAAGASGRGLTERFLILSEQSKLGYRNFDISHTPDSSLYRRYESLIENIINEHDVTLQFDEESKQIINSYMKSIESDLREDGEYSHSLLTGFMGKAPKHIMKIAAVMHCAEKWQDGEDRSPIIKGETTITALSTFRELAKTFINASDSMGYVGLRSECYKLSELFESFAKKGTLKVSIRQLRDRIKNSKPFKGSRNLTQRLKDKLLPELEKSNYIIVNNNDVHINPRLK